MTEEQAVAAWAQLKAWLIDLSKIIVAVGIVGGALLAGTRYALREYIPLPEVVAELAGTGREAANQLATIEARLAGANAPPPILEFQHEAYVLPAAVRSGQDVRVVYYQRRNNLDGITERSLVSAVPTVLRRRLAGLPKGLEPDQVRRLLAACDGSTAVGCRDLAILPLLVRLGLRRSEVVRLTLDDIDWRGGTMIVAGKGGRVERLPLPADVGHRMAEYLERARPADARAGPCSSGTSRLITRLGRAV
jgi:integrase